MSAELIPTTPPTDNLYKFFLIFGLALIVTGVFTHVQTYDRLTKATSNFIEKKKIADYRMLEHALEIEALKIAKDNVGAKEFWDSYREMNKTTSEKDLAAAEKTLAEFEMVAATSLFRDAETYSYGLAGIGLVFSLGGFLLWYFKFQRYQDAILRHEVKLTESKAKPEISSTTASPKKQEAAKRKG